MTESTPGGHDRWMKAVAPPVLGSAQEADATVGPAAPTLEALYRDHFRFVWRSARRLGVAPSLLDDVVQDVFMIVQRQLPSYEPRCSPRAWLFAITRRVAADHRRTLRRRGGVLSLHEETYSRLSEGPLQHAMNKERSDAVIEFLGTLDDSHREVFILRELEQLRAPEIAEAVNANTNTVYSRIRSARRAFVQYVREHHPEWMGEANG